MKTKPVIIWLPEPEAHDYPAAASYLRLLFDPTAVALQINRMVHASMIEFKAKDIFRASGLSLLGISNSHVKANQRKIRKGQALSPLLLVADDNRVVATIRGAIKNPVPAKA
jgi:hypothetical protein